jgi:hypothetical protein
MPTPRLAPSNVSISAETLTYMAQCEAREWISRYKAKASTLGAERARSWWDGVKHDIAKRRGQAGLDTLVSNMNAERAKK